MIKRCSNLQGKKSDLCDVEVLAPQQPMHVMEVHSEMAVVFQVEYFLGAVTTNSLNPNFAASIPKMKPSNWPWLLDELPQGQHELAMLVVIGAIIRKGPD